MIEKGLLPEYPKEVQSELKKIEKPAATRKGTRDKTDLLWVSIDNIDSLDLDQLTYAEKISNEKDRIYIAVADVDALVKNGSAIDLCARHNTTSVYTPGRVFAMLPPKLSTNLTSLNENEERSAIVIEMDIDKDGRFELHDLYPARVRNKAKLVYENVAEWLEMHQRMEPFSEEIHAQLKLQDTIARRIHSFRVDQGALGFDTIELQAVMIAKIAVRLEPRKVNQAHRLIENYMIAANVGATQYLKQHDLPVLQRVVRKPKRWSRIMLVAKELGDHLPTNPNVKALRDFLVRQQLKNPQDFHDLSLTIIKLIGKGEYVMGLPGKQSIGHFDLALHDYAHTTAPNRRYPDLIMQRLLKSQLFQERVPYNQKELSALAKHCTEKEDDATKVERRMIKCAAAMVMKDQIGQRFPALVTGAGRKGTWVRLYDPPVEGRVVRGCGNLDVGDHIKVELLSVNIRKGHIDFKGCL